MMPFSDDAAPDAGRFAEADQGNPTAAADAVDGNQGAPPFSSQGAIPEIRLSKRRRAVRVLALQVHGLTDEEMAWLQDRDPSIQAARRPSPPRPKPTPCIRYRKGGTLVEIDTGIRPHRPGPPPTQRKRGRIGRWNWRMRQRMIEHCARILADVPMVMITLTYRLRHAPSAATCLAHRQEFARLMRLYFPDVGMTYRIDRQGNRTLHAHILATGWNAAQAEQGRELWLYASGQADDPYARLYAYQVSPADEGAAPYAAKYAARLTDADVHDPADGKLWGVLNRKALPFAPEVIIPLQVHEAAKLIQLTRLSDEARAAAAGWQGTPPSSPYHRTLIQAKPEGWADVHEAMHGTKFPNSPNRPDSEL